MLKKFIKIFLYCGCIVYSIYAYSNTKSLTLYVKQPKKSNILSNFHDNYSKLYYFAEEVTNYTDAKTPSPYDYVDPFVNVGLDQFEYSIIPGLLLLDNLEKTQKERKSMHDINFFLDMNYKTQHLPSQAYSNNQHLERPLYVLQLQKLAFEATKKGDLYALRALLDNYNVINTNNDEGYGLLSYAILSKQNEIAEFLIKRGIDVNAVNKFGASPINIAARTNNFHMVKILAENPNCNVFHRDKFGNAAADYAFIINNQTMLSYLQSFNYHQN